MLSEKKGDRAEDVWYDAAAFRSWEAPRRRKFFERPAAGPISTHFKNNLFPDNWMTTERRRSLSGWDRRERLSLGAQWIGESRPSSERARRRLPAVNRTRSKAPYAKEESHASDRLTSDSGTGIGTGPGRTSHFRVPAAERIVPRAALRWWWDRVALPSSATVPASGVRRGRAFVIERPPGVPVPSGAEASGPAARLLRALGE